MTEPLRITFVLGHAGIYGGVRVVASLGERLRRRGHRVVIVSTPLPRPTWRTHLRRLMGRWPAPPPEIRQSYFDGLDVEHRVLDRPRPVETSDVPDADVVIATWWETAEWVAAMPPAKGAKVHFIQQFDANVGAPTDRVEATWNLPMRKIVCSPWLADLARERFCDPHAVVVPNGVDPDLFHAPPRGKQAHPTIGLMYSTHPNKGCRESLGAIAMVRRRITDLRVVAFGVENPPRHLPLPGYASYTKLPPQPTLRDLYARCDVWLCASHSEGFHLPPHEAMACRCPVVSTRVGGPMDMVVDGINGYLVDTGEEHALADRLLRVLSLDEDGWRAMSDAALRTAMEYSWDSAADLFETALRRSVP
ncbi:MAG TPA: glycosyltransferase family 4 protein [Candidatus Methylomirabilis sp.]|nr:glycosyltransferase family 4 protein [Candidatus Methylomirabilis sp.]